MNDLELRRALYENVAVGMMEIVGEREGEPLFRLTDAGRKFVYDLIDATIDEFGNEAPEALADKVGVPIEIAAGLILDRMDEREAESE